MCSRGLDLHNSEEISLPSGVTHGVIVKRLCSTGRGKVRKEAFAKGRSQSILCLVLDVQKGVAELQQKETILEVGIVTSKKQVSKSAVKRNLAKRRMRAALHLFDDRELGRRCESIGIFKMRLLLVCSRDVMTQPFLNLVDDLNIAFLRAVHSIEMKSKREKDAH